ncbi:MAG: metallophosphoesterase [Gammaproteobacteria bacterium]|nr:metallophosphoesterase [Gammaproteobacteria bacterium]
MNGLQQSLFPDLAGILRRLLWSGLLVLLVSTFGLTACSDNSETQSVVSEDGNAELSIALTDAEGDFVSYTVDVVSLTLTKANGTVVETLPLKTRVDFAQYTDMTEFLTIATIPAGVYVKGSMVLDYSNAEILVENADGQPVSVSAANIKDGDGNVVTEMEMSVKLEDRTHLAILPGVPAHLSLDFDLKASNEVVFTADVPAITVQPQLLAEVNVENHKQHRVRGPLKEVQVDGNKFQVYIRPFFHHVARNNHRHFGVLNVETDDETIYEINGETYQGQTGLELMADVAQYSAVAVLGDIKHKPRRFIAKQVYAGSGVPGGDLDVTRGSVIARSGDVLTVKGMTFLRENGSITFNDTVKVSIDDSTTILKALKLGTFNKNDISVGQFVTVFGAVDGIGNDRIMNAANGYARMEISYLRAARVDAGEAAPYDFVINLKRINGRDIAQFDFAGTGIDAANDALANAYEVETGALNVSGIAVDDHVRVRGHVTPFSSAPADFDAVTVIKLPASSGSN